VVRSNRHAAPLAHREQAGKPDVHKLAFNERFGMLGHRLLMFEIAYRLRTG
jgi:hypothetical protein